MSDWKGISLLVVVFVFGIIMLIGCLDGEEKEIREWVNARSERVIEIDNRFIDIGPYWPVKNARYYYVKTDKNVYWVKYMFGRTINQEIGDGKYVELE